MLPRADKCLITYKRPSLSSFQTTNSTLKTRSELAETIEPDKEKKFEFVFSKTADCYLDGCGIHDSSFLFFKTKSL